jgi:hypothetical protein
MRLLVLPLVLAPLLLTAGAGQSSVAPLRFPSPVNAAMSALPLVSSAGTTRFLRVDLQRSSAAQRAYRVEYSTLRIRHSLVAVVTPLGSGYWRLHAYRASR